MVSQLKINSIDVGQFFITFFDVCYQLKLYIKKYFSS